MNEARAGSQKNKFSKIRIAVAFFIAVFADIILLPFEPALPLCTIIDCIVAVILYFILGCPIILLPALIAEALPGIGIFPFWTLVVVSIGAFGTITATGKSSSQKHSTDSTYLQ